MRRHLFTLVFFVSLLNPSAEVTACALSEFAARYVQAYRSQGVADDCYYRLVDDLDTARTLQTQVGG